MNQCVKVQGGATYDDRLSSSLKYRRYAFICLAGKLTRGIRLTYIQFVNKVMWDSRQGRLVLGLAVPMVNWR